MRHPIDHHLEYFAFHAPDGACVVVMLRGVWMAALDGLSPRKLSTPARILRICDHLRGEVRGYVERAGVNSAPSAPASDNPSR